MVNVMAADRRKRLVAMYLAVSLLGLGVRVWPFLSAADTRQCAPGLVCYAIKAEAVAEAYADDVIYKLRAALCGGCE